MKYISKLGLILFLILSVNNAYALPTAKITIKVVDQDGVPVEGAKVAANFSVGGSGSLDKGRTDSEGLATLSNSGIRHVEYGAHKEGYYRSGNEYDFKNITGITGYRRWQPWNESLTLVLNKIKNPRALYIGNHQGKRLGKSLELPMLNKKYGYDLMAGDWVVPNGSGIHSDFVFKIVNNSEGKDIKGREFDYSFVMSFNNEGDGIQIHNADPIYGSQLRLPHEAPISGYKKELIQRKARTNNYFSHNDFPENRNYFFRVRTKIDDEGNIESALYGKIYGNITFSGKNIGMLYYLNPDENDRNLESDYKKNLFPSKKRHGYTEYPP